MLPRDPQYLPPDVGASLSLRYRAVPIAVADLRHRVVRLARTNGATDAACSDVALAISEAATNVVRHAYAGDPGPGVLELDARVEDGCLEVVVGDDGRGVRTRPDSPGVGLGLAILAGVTDAFEVRDRRPRGTEIWARFRLSP